MTRINVVCPKTLSRQHLVAEYRELPRVFTLAHLREDIPPTYRMGKGHVLFFYDKLKWVAERYDSLVLEMVQRGYKPNQEIVDSVQLTVDILPKVLYNDYVPTREAIQTNLGRLIERDPEHYKEQHNEIHTNEQHY